MAAPVAAAGNEENWFTKTGQYFVSDQHIFGKSINKVAEMSGQKNTNVLLGVIFLASMVFIMSEEPKPQMMCHLICITYLTQRTVVALIFGANDEISKWLFCWVSVSPFYLIDVLFELINVYWMAKTVYMLALMLPPIDLLGEAYSKIVKPLILLSQGRIDRETLIQTNPFILKRLHLDAGKVQTISDAELQQVNSSFKALIDEIFGQLANAPPQAAPGVGQAETIAPAKKTTSS